MPSRCSSYETLNSPETLEVIQTWNATGNIDKLILLDQNEGGCAFNRAVPFVTGSCVHISENDLEYRPGWDTILLPKCDAFPRLGQLSLFHPNPNKTRERSGPDIGLVGRRPQGMLFGPPSTT